MLALLLPNLLLPLPDIPRVSLLWDLQYSMRDQSTSNSDSFGSASLTGQSGRLANTALILAFSFSPFRPRTSRRGRPCGSSLCEHVSDMN